MTSAAVVATFHNATAEPEQILIIKLPNLRAFCRAYSISLIVLPDVKAQPIPHIQIVVLGKPKKHHGLTQVSCLSRSNTIHQA